MAIVRYGIEGNRQMICSLGAVGAQAGIFSWEIWVGIMILFVSSHFPPKVSLRCRRKKIS